MVTDKARLCMRAGLVVVGPMSAVGPRMDCRLGHRPEPAAARSMFLSGSRGRRVLVRLAAREVLLAFRAVGCFSGMLLVRYCQLPGLGLSESRSAAWCMPSRAVSENPAWPARVRLGLSLYELHERRPVRLGLPASPARGGKIQRDRMAPAGELLGLVTDSEWVTTPTPTHPSHSTPICRLT